MSGIVIHRSHHAQQYVVIPNRIARDRRLSFRARGLLVMLLSLPPEWHVRTDMLAEDNPDSRNAIRAAMKELRDTGYVMLVQERGDDGRTRRHLEVFDTVQGIAAEDPKTKRGQVAFGPTCENDVSSQVAPNAGKPNAGFTALNRSTERKHPRRSRPGGHAAGCSTDHPGPLSEACRRNDGPLCLWSWCLCTCHPGNQR